MATYYAIPLQPQPQTFTISLSGVTYTFTLLYRNAPLAGWVLDIADANGAPIVQGIPLVTGVNLLAQYAYLGFVGALWVQTQDNPDAVPTFSNLGNDGQLLPCDQPMTQQYLRKLSLVVATSSGAGFDFSQFRCVFTVKRGDFQTPNSLDARIYNLKQETVSKISKLEFTTISLSVCYQPPGTMVTPALLFQGTIRQFRVGRIDQLDSYVDITAADSDEAYNFAPISQPVPAGQNAGSIAATIQSAFANASKNQQITKGYTPNFVQDPLVRGRVLYGMARDEARDFANQNDCKWSFQNGAVTYVPYVSYIPSGQVPVISVSTGLLGVPEQTQAGINVRILLNPSIKIGQLIQLNSQINKFRFALDLPSQTSNTAIALQNQTAPDDQQGFYYVMVANHKGDTRGEEWESNLVCLAVDATLTNLDQANALIQTGPNPIARYGGT